MAETPEVQELSKLIRVAPQVVEEVLFVMQHCDPYLNRQELFISPLLLPCQKVWDRFGQWNTLKLAKLAGELSEYFKT